MRTGYVGTAGWTIPGNYAHQFASRHNELRAPSAGTHLERYSRVFPAVEINSSFQRAHKRSTYKRWADSVPTGFLFAVKAPQEITHLARLKNVREALARFLEAAGGLGDKLAPILFQLPPSLEFDAELAAGFFELLRELYGGPSVLEARHQSWFEPEPEDLLKRFRVARVVADPPPRGLKARRVPGTLGPARVLRTAEPGGWRSLVYFRLHGSPRMYYSAYSDEFLQDLSARIMELAGTITVWCIFDNTAAGAAIGNALTLLKSLGAVAGS